MAVAEGNAASVVATGIEEETSEPEYPPLMPPTAASSSAAKSPKSRHDDSDSSDDDGDSNYKSRTNDKAAKVNKFKEHKAKAINVSAEPSEIRRPRSPTAVEVIKEKYKNYMAAAAAKKELKATKATGGVHFKANNQFIELDYLDLAGFLRDEMVKQGVEEGQLLAWKKLAATIPKYIAVLMEEKYLALGAEYDAYNPSRKRTTECSRISRMRYDICMQSTNQNLNALLRCTSALVG